MHTNPNWLILLSSSQGLDYAVAEAKKVGIRLILSFVNNYADYGGRKQYATWAQRYAGKWNAKEDDFYTDGTIRQWYRNHIRVRLHIFLQMCGLC